MRDHTRRYSLRWLQPVRRFVSYLPQSSQARLVGACSNPIESKMAEAGGFEPPVGCPTLVFKTIDPQAGEPEPSTTVTKRKMKTPSTAEWTA